MAFELGLEGCRGIPQVEKRLGHWKQQEQRPGAGVGVGRSTQHLQKVILLSLSVGFVGGGVASWY